MGNTFKSFIKDWRRWSAAERQALALVAAVFAVTVTLSLSGRIPLPFS